MATLGNLRVGVIVDSRKFQQSLNVIISALRRAQGDLNKITGTSTKHLNQMAKAEKAVEKGRQKTSMDSRRALQQQYYQTASLQRLSMMMAGITTGMVLFGKTTLTAFMNFEQKMADTRAAAQATNREFDQMIDLAMEMGRTTVYSAQEVAEGMEILAKAGFRAQSILEGLDGALLLAGATGENFQKGTELLIATLYQFNIAAERSAEVANIMAGGAQFSLATIQNLGQGMKYLGPVMHQMNQRLDVTVTALAALTNAGVRAQMGGRILSTGMLRLNSATKAVIDGLGMLNIRFAEVNPTIVDLTKIIGRFERAQDETANATRFNQAMLKIWGVRAIRVMAPLITLGEQGFRVLTERINEAGTAEAMMLVRTDTLKFAIKRFRNVLQNLLIGLGKASGVAGLKGFIAGLTELLKILEGTSDRTKSVVAQFGTFSIAAAVAVTAIFGMIAAFATLKLALNELALAQSALSMSFLAHLGKWPVFLGLIGAATVATYVFIKVVQSMRNELDYAKTSIAKARLELMQTENTLEMLALQYKKAKDKLAEVKKGTDEYADAEADLRSVVVQLVRLMPEYADELEGLAGSYENLNEKIDDTISKMKLLRLEAAKEAIRGLEKKPWFKIWGEALKIPIEEIFLGKPGAPWRKIPKIYKDVNEAVSKILQERLRVTKEYADEIARILLGPGWTAEGLKWEEPRRAKTELKLPTGPSKEFYEYLRELGIDYEIETAQRYKRERLKLQQKYEKDIDTAKKNAEKMQATGAQLQSALMTIRLKYAEKFRQINAEELKDTIEKMNEGLEAKEKFQDQALKLEQQAVLRRLTGKNKELAELEVRYQQELDALWDNLVQALEAHKEYQDKKAEVDQDYFKHKDRVLYQQELLKAQTEAAKELGLYKTLMDAKKALDETYSAKKEEVAKKLDEMEEERLRILIDGVADLTTAWENFGEAFHRIALGVIKDLIRMTIRMALMRALGVVPLPQVEAVGTGRMVSSVGGGFQMRRISSPPVDASMARVREMAGGPLPVLRAEARSMITNYNFHITGDVLEMTEFYKRKIRPAMRRIEAGKLSED